MDKKWVLFFLFFVYASVVFSENRISGTFTANSKPVTLKYVDAKWIKGHDPEDGMWLEIWVSDKVLPDGRDFLASEEERYNAIHFTYSKKIDRIISCNFMHSAFSRRYLTSTGYHKVKLTVLNDNVAEGKIWMDAPNEFFGDTFQYALEFKADIGKNMKTTVGAIENRSH